MTPMYVGLADVKQLLSLDGVKVTGDGSDDMIINSIRHFSRYADNFCHRRFTPLLETRHYNISDSVVSMYFEDFTDLSSISYSLDDGANYTAFVAADYYLKTSDSFESTYSYNFIELSLKGSIVRFPVGQRALQLVATWAYSDDKGSLFLDSLDTVGDNPLSDSATTLTVNDADGISLSGSLHRFQVGSFLQIESEYVYVRDVDYSKNELTVVRGVNGTTAASYVQNTEIKVFQPPDSVSLFVLNNSYNLAQRNILLGSKLGKASNARDVGLTRIVNPADPISIDLLRPHVRVSI